ncbi:MAG: DNA polymerase III subunit delta [Patescibacteria group bacterium]|nr:DNA polymerase III subunit delta [Patescibacteria group bacterium]
MIILLYGPDTYRSQLKLREIVESYKKIHKSGLNLRYYNNDLNFKDLKSEAAQASMFKEKKLIVLTDIFSNSDFKKDFLKGGKDFVDSENILLFYEKGKITKRDALLTFLKKNAKCQELESLEGQKLKNWVKKQFDSLNAKVDNRALDRLVSFVGDNLWQMINEIRKLSSFKAGKTIEVKDVELMVRPKIESDIFKTIEAIASKDKQRALKLLKDHLKKGDNPFYLLSMINFQFRNLLIVKDLVTKNLSPFDSAGLHPYVVKKSMALSRKFEFQELKKIYQKIFEVDLNLKTGKIEPETALDLFIAEI